MGIQVTRIEKEFIFMRLRQEGTEVSVHGDKKEARFRIESFNDDVIILQTSETDAVAFEQKELIRIFFIFQNNYYTFNSQVSARTQKGMAISNPKSICRDPQRKYERIKLKGVTLFFLLEGDRVELDFPKTDTFTLIEKPDYSAGFNPERIQDLITSFRSSLQNRVSECAIVMYRDRAPNAFEERITVKLGKALWIPSTAEDLPLNDPDFSGNVIVKKEVEDYLAASGTPPSQVRSEVAALLSAKVKNGLTAELVCPILYHEYAVGYIRLLNKKPRTDRFPKELLKETIVFSRVLSYALEINGYFRPHAKGSVEHAATVIDMSASGLLFAAAGTDLERKLELFNDVRLHCEIDGRTIEMGTRIMRKFKDAERSYFAAQFLDISENDFNFIFEFLYGKPFTEESRQTWEGGAPPPMSPPQPQEMK